MKYPPQAAPMPTTMPQRYTGQPAPVAQYGPPAQAVPQLGWQQPGYSQSPYQSRATPAAPGIPYAYGQLPANVNPHDPKSQHPIPGSYNRHAFNPKTQSFVPGNGMVQMQAQPPVPYGTASPHHGSPQFNAPHMNYNGYQQAPYGGANGPGYGMVPAGSSNAMPPYHAAQVAAGPQVPHGPPPVQQQNQLPHIPNKPVIPHGPGQAYGTLPNYGNPATLPQKPAT
jgi:hypothetical protein